MTRALILAALAAAGVAAGAVPALTRNPTGGPMCTTKATLPCGTRNDKMAKLTEELAYLKRREDEQRVMAEESDSSGQVRPALSLLGLQIKKAHALVAQLEDRLDVLLLPSDMNKAAPDPLSTRPASQLTGELREHYGAVRSLLDRLSSLSNRIDL